MSASSFPEGIHNVNVIGQKVLITPEELREQLPPTERGQTTVRESRQIIQNILDRRDHRLLVIVGPCSIHDVKAAKEYAKRLKQLHDQLQDTLYLVMRIYFEKPRTTIGWKGLINDPNLDESCDIEQGLKTARELLHWVADLGLPSATEALDPITPQYLSDLYGWAAVGARTTESQTHREMASGLSMPVGFKNGTDGNLDVAINALKSAALPHNFIGINRKGQVTIVQTKGNRYGHVILRGGKTPNYDSVNVRLCEEALQEANLPINVIVDCSHANSYKKHDLQPLVVDNVVNQILQGNHSIMGLMLESHLNEGKQNLPAPAELHKLRYGVSITDACIGWETTDILLRNMADKLRQPLLKRMEQVTTV